MLTKAEIRQKCEERAKAKAKVIGMASWLDCAVEVLPTEQYAEVMSLWKTLPGNTCWNDAFLKWLETLPS